MNIYHNLLFDIHLEISNYMKLKPCLRINYLYPYLPPENSMQPNKPCDSTFAILKLTVCTIQSSCTESPWQKKCYEFSKTSLFSVATFSNAMNKCLNLIRLRYKRIGLAQFKCICCLINFLFSKWRTIKMIYHICN